jgi:Fic family protein
MKSLGIAFQSLVTYRDKKRGEGQKASEVIYEITQMGFNKRQSDLDVYLFINPKAKITVPIYSKRHHIVRQTASRDLIDLEEKGIFVKSKEVKTMVFELIDIEKT